jgi:adenine nucleotide transporter 17
LPLLLWHCRYNGTWDAIVRIAQEEGLAGFYKGMQAKILQTALNAALMLMIKEQVGAEHQPT